MGCQDRGLRLLAINPNGPGAERGCPAHRGGELRTPKVHIAGLFHGRGDVVATHSLQGRGPSQGSGASLQGSLTHSNPAWDAAVRAVISCARQRVPCGPPTVRCGRCLQVLCGADAAAHTAEADHLRTTLSTASLRHHRRPGRRREAGPQRIPCSAPCGGCMEQEESDTHLHPFGAEEIAVAREKAAAELCDPRVVSMTPTWKAWRPLRHERRQSRLTRCTRSSYPGPQRRLLDRARQHARVSPCNQGLPAEPGGGTRRACGTKRP